MGRTAGHTCAIAGQALLRARQVSCNVTLMTELIRYEPQDAIAILQMDDGKVNALSQAMIDALNAALDRAAAANAAVLIAGRPGVFSAGFDRNALMAGGPAAGAMVQAGFKLAERLFTFPRPVVIACSGHALAMGAFLMLASDHRIGAQGAFRIGANEVAIGLTMPYFAIEICRQRLTPSHFQRAVMHAEIFDPEQAVAAGFLDAVASAAELHARAIAIASQLAKLPPAVYLATKLRARAHSIAAVHAAIELDAQAQ